MRPAIAAVVVVFVSSLASGIGAQTIAPVIAEYDGKGHGKFEILNGTLYPMSVVLEPVSFSVDDEGRASYSPLDPSIHLRLSTTSFRVDAKQAYTVFYEAEADQRPAWFTIYATVTGPRPAAGLQIALRLPHTVYLLTKRKLVRDSVVVRSVAVLDSVRVVAEIENRGPALGRSKRVELRAGQRSQTYAGFPLFPGRKRVLRLEWNHPEPPDHLLLGFDSFVVELAVPSP